MKNFMKIGALSLLLIASLVLLTNNETHAAATAGQVSFSITGVTNVACTYGTSWNMGSYTANLSAFTASGAMSNFTCTDTQGQASFSMTLLANSAVSNGTTSIAATNVSMQATTNTVTAGTCTAGTNTTSMTAIGSTPGTILTKSAAVNQICTITTSSVMLNVAVPAAATLGAYSGTLSVTVPW